MELTNTDAYAYAYGNFTRRLCPIYNSEILFITMACHNKIVS